VTSRLDTEYSAGTLTSTCFMKAWIQLRNVTLMSGDRRVVWEGIIVGGPCDRLGWVWWEGSARRWRGNRAVICMVEGKEMVIWIWKRSHNFHECHWKRKDEEYSIE
jgi:hypothetical protein